MEKRTFEQEIYEATKEAEQLLSKMIQEGRITFEEWLSLTVPVYYTATTLRMSETKGE